MLVITLCFPELCDPFLITFCPLDCHLVHGIALCFADLCVPFLNTQKRAVLGTTLCFADLCDLFLNTFCPLY